MNTQKNNVSPYASPETKPHYEILDGLRGVVALMVVWYHIFEGFATSPIDQRFNHGYMAVDFFFILSGFVTGYAYDNRWKTMGKKEFFKRRLIRLHPMVLLGAIFGVITFCIQGCAHWDGTPVPVPMIMVAFLFTLLMIPALPGTSPDIRGNGEMFPLNGPAWSLFFEYIGNIFYALLLRKLPTKLLAIVTSLLGIGLALFAIMDFSGAGHIGVGWSLGGNNFIGGLLRMLFSYSAGLLLSRIFKPANPRGESTFWICSIVLFFLLGMPHLGTDQAFWKNGIYDSFCVILIFPALVYLGASGKTTTPIATKLCKLLGDISFPLYMIHYPIMYLFYAWLWKPDPHITFSDAWPVALGIFLGCIILAYVALKFYDQPVRKFLSSRFSQKS